MFPEAARVLAPPAVDRGPPSGGAWLLVMPMRAAGRHVLVVVGEADSSTADQLRAELVAALAARPPSVLVELSGLDFCDLAGLDALHDCARAAADAGVTLAFRGMSPQLAWLHRTFPPAPRVPSPRVHRGAL